MRAYESLRVAEYSLPRAADVAELSDSELSFMYRPAVRDLRYGAELLLAWMQRREEAQPERALVVLERGFEWFDHASNLMDRAAEADRHAPEDADSVEAVEAPVGS